MGFIPLITRKGQNIGSVQTDSQIGAIRNFVRRKLNLDHVGLAAGGRFLMDDQKTLKSYGNFSSGTIITQNGDGRVDFS